MLARMLLALLRGEEREAVAGDLHEEYQEMVRERGLDAARTWFWQQTRASLISRAASSPAATERAASPFPRKGDSFMETLLQDVRYAFRTLARNPGFAAIAIVTLALGIGLNTTIFAWIKAVAIESLPGVTRSQHLVVLGGMNRKGGDCCNGVSYLHLKDFSARSKTLTGILGWEIATVNVDAGSGEDARVRGTIVTENYFDVLGVKAAIGRTFLPDEGQAPGSHPVAVISHGTWQRVFGGDPQIAGRQVRINKHPFTIIGVMPREFSSAVPGLAFEIFVPAMMQPQLVPGQNMVTNRNSGWLDAVGRLKPGVSVAEARAEMDVIAQQIEKDYPGTFPEMTLGVFKFTESPVGLIGMVFSISSVLMALVGLLLLIACGTVANLLVARASERRREIAVRMALGAGRGRLLRQMLTESAMLGLTAGALGLLFGAWSSRAIEGLLPFRDMPIAFNLQVDGYVLAFTLVISLLTAMIFGVAPALQATRKDVAGSLKDQEAGRGRLWWRSALVSVQVGLSVITLVCAGLFLRSLNAARDVNPGFSARNGVMVSMDIFPAGYTGDTGRQFYAQLLERVKALAGVAGATLARRPPLTARGARGTNIQEIEGYKPGEKERLGSIFDTVGAEYFRTMETPLLAGRDFTAQDVRTSAPVVIVNENFARKYWPNETATGKHVRIADKWTEVIGVARNVQYRSLGESGRLYMYAPHQQVYEPDMTLIVRHGGNSTATVEAIRQAVRSLDAKLPLFEIKSMEQHVAGAMSGQRIAAQASTVFGALALLLACAGIYGVLSYTTSRRMHEIGLRVALGAQPGDIARMIGRQGLVMVGAGLIVGLGAAMAASKALEEMLFGVKPTDPVTYAGIAALFLAVAVLACWAPARRAMRVDPVVALRHE